MSNEEEIEKLSKAILQFRGILKTTRKAAVLARTKEEIKKLSEQLDRLKPGASAQLLRDGQVSQDDKSHSNEVDKTKTMKVISRYSVEPVHIACNDNAVNVIAMMIKAWDQDFSAALSEKHVQLYFSHAAERDSHFRLYDLIARHLDGLIKSYDDFYTAPDNEYKQQFWDAKERNSRQFLNESVGHLNKIKDFWQGLDDDIQSGGTTCLNKSETIVMDKQYEGKSFLDGKTAEEAISLAATFYKEGLALVNLPVLKKKEV